MTVSELQYADEAAFVSHTISELQRVVSSVHSAYARAWLSMNLMKTEVLAQHTVQQSGTPRIYVDSAELLVTERFTYHGSIISPDCSLDEEVSRSISLAPFAFGRLTHSVVVNHRLSLATKRSVYQAICISV